MTLEAIACSHCGSSAVKEVKADTYFCDHCETVFKHIDPALLGSNHVQSFCSCGGAVEAQCQICRRGVCRRCDAPQALVDPDRFGDPYCIPTSSSGYLVRLGSGWRSVLDGQLGENRLTAGIAGPLLYAEQVVEWLRSSRHDLRHVCWSCAETAAHELSGRIAAGELCRSARHFGPSSPEVLTHCSCCGGMFCGECIVRDGKLAILWWTPFRGGLRRGDRVSASIDAENSLCRSCFGEHRAKVYEVYAHDAALRHELRQGDVGRYEVITQRRLIDLTEGMANRRAMDTMKRCAEYLVKEYSKQRNGPCNWKAGFDKAEPWAEPVFIDDRGDGQTNFLGSRKAFRAGRQAGAIT
jgi:hypothetical protein